ncbi:glutathione-dependent formaldehyde-activating enzyme [Xylariaceae sp. AK1471]|nr:glutathione-dependent formaldehyde-activating enzyme [Xylariaceae sp. AK1471]
MASEEQKPKSSVTYEAGCHCGYIKFAVTLSPGLDEYEVLRCNCSAYPEAKDVVWHNDGRERCVNYRFNTKRKDQMFCPKCGASLGIDFSEALTPHTYGISARTIYGIDLDKLIYRKSDGINEIKPAGDLSGHYWDEEKQETK